MEEPRPTPPGSQLRVLFLRTVQLSPSDVQSMFGGFGNITVTPMTTSPTGLADYEVAFADPAQLALAAELKHQKITYSTIKTVGEAAPADAPTTLPLPQASQRWYPPLTCDNLPYWTSEEDLRDLFSIHGTVKEVKFALNDLNGCHFGCCQVTMGSWEEMEKAEENLDGKRVGGNMMVVGVLSGDGRQITSSKGGVPRSMGTDMSRGVRLNFGIPGFGGR
eukprot:TRINITY_DN18344_c0_g1_i2.p1 TRINITY_DN18344_c0_g1~~TRINITY_DN18344_c0_g1_i2.p1  ORF type:complete len:238 (+),score=55.09 TRINITY_DN18344_c0_g1_i2:56-715(+)